MTNESEGTCNEDRKALLYWQKNKIKAKSRPRRRTPKSKATNGVRGITRENDSSHSGQHMEWMNAPKDIGKLQTHPIHPPIHPYSMSRHMHSLEHSYHHDLKFSQWGWLSSLSVPSLAHPLWFGSSGNNGKCLSYRDLARNLWNTNDVLVAIAHSLVISY